MTSRSRPPDRWLSLIPDLDTLDPDHPPAGAPHGRPRTEHGATEDGATEDGATEDRDDTPQPTAAETGQRTQTPTGLLPLYTPAEAATLLAVRESWLRRRAAARTIACTFLGKHLRFSPADLHAIITANTHHPSAHPCRPTSMRRRNARTAPPPRAASTAAHPGRARRG